MLKRSLIDDLVTDARAIGEIAFAAITIGALSEATVKLIDAGPFVDFAIGALAPTIVVLRAAERGLEMWRKYWPRFRASSRQASSRQDDQPPGCG